MRRELDHSLLTDVRRGGAPYVFSPGQRVTLWAEESVIFQGRAVDAREVLDLISTEKDEDLGRDETI